MGITSSCAAIWKTLSPEVYTMGAGADMFCAQFLEISVPEAGLLPRSCARSCLEASIISGGKPCL